VLSPDSLRTSLDFADTLLEQSRVAVTPGEAFDAPGTIRISYATSLDLLEEGSKRLLEFVAKHAPQTAPA
jgi:aspartate aminotransferase